MNLSLHIDPGKHKLACAVFYCSRVFAVRSLAPADFFSPNIISKPAELGLINIEKPQLYPGSDEKDPNDCVDVFGSARYAEAALASRGAPPAEYVYPREWKGQVKKPQHHSWVWNELSEAERGVVAAGVGMTAEEIRKKIHDACERYAMTRKVTRYSWEAHNLLDAVALGLWRLGRLRGPHSPAMVAARRGRESFA